MITPLPADNHKKITPIRDTSAQDRPIDQKPKLQQRRYKLIAAGGAGLLVMLVIGLLVRNWLAAEISVPRERIRIAEVTRGPFIRDVAAQGTVVAAVSPTLYATAAGTVHFLVRAGDVVKKGQQLATVESPELVNELKREQNALAALELAVERQAIDTRQRLAANQQAIDLANVTIQAAERELRRAEDAWRDRVISERDYEKARDDAAAARVNHKHAIETAQLQKESLEFELRARRLERDRQRLVVEDLQRRVDELTVKSPVDGVVGTLVVTERTSVAQNAPLLTVVDLSAFEIEFTVPESYADDLGLGMEAEVTYGAKKYPAKVSAVSPEVRQGQVTGRLRFSGETPQGLRQNQRVAARIVLESRDNVLKVARGAFLDSGGGGIAYVIRDDIATRTKIRIGSTSISEVEILEGLEAGDRIIISNLGAFERVETVRLTD
ncbi:MAG TPA: HlyD family efflux transporter periplasmic adaptor subunit [Steroidobacter sp.]